RIVVRDNARPRLGIACLARATRDVGAFVDTGAGTRVLQLAIGARNRIADTAATAQIKMLAARTLIAETELLAANLVRATDGPILLSHASQALAGLGIARLTLRTIVDALVVATGFSGTAIDRTTHPTRARLTCVALRL